jgi:hypothetical protein
LGASIGNLDVELPPPLVERTEVGLAPGQRPAARRASLPRRLGVDVEEDAERTLSKGSADRRRLDGAPSESDHRRVRPLQHGKRLALLVPAELALAALLEELGDRLAELLLDCAVDIDEGAAEPHGDGGPERRLPGAHEADQRQVTA